MGFDVLQLLPVNDTSIDGTWRDSYPYSTLSVFAQACRRPLAPIHPAGVCTESSR